MLMICLYRVIPRAVYTGGRDSFLEWRQMCFYQCIQERRLVFTT
jgi:hypothetical protein